MKKIVIANFPLVSEFKTGVGEEQGKAGKGFDVLWVAQNSSLHQGKPTNDNKKGRRQKPPLNN